MWHIVSFWRKGSSLLKQKWAVPSASEQSAGAKVISFASQKVSSAFGRWSVPLGGEQFAGAKVIRLAMPMVSSPFGKWSVCWSRSEQCLREVSSLLVQRWSDWRCQWWAVPSGGEQFAGAKVIGLAMPMVSSPFGKWSVCWSRSEQCLRQDYWLNN